MVGWRARVAAAAIGTAVLTLPVIADAAPLHKAQRSHLFVQVDSVKVTGHSIAVRGWVADHASARPALVAVSVDGRVLVTQQAALPRPDVAKAYPALLAYHGFATSVRATNGLHQLCVTTSRLDTNTLALARIATKAILAGTGKGPEISGTRCFTVAVGPATKAPVGYVDTISYFGGILNVAGWTVDPDAPKVANRVVIKYGTTVLASGPASQERTDVGFAYPRYGAGHGFTIAVTVPWTAGRYVVCAYGMNTSVGKNTRLGCRAVLVPDAASVATQTGAFASGSTAGWASITSAADQLQAQAVAVGAATPTDFTIGASPAARIALATRALLRQATGRSTAPVAQPGLPAFTVAGPTVLADEQAVMGPTAINAKAPAVGGRAGPTASLTAFAADPVTLQGSAGVGLKGAAPVRPADGVTVSPALPGYPAGYQPLRAEVAVDEALSHLGQPYVWAASGPSTFDCSGLTKWAWAKAGVNLTHYTNSQAVQGVRVQPNQLLPGDLVFFGADLHHVGMYLGSGYMIDAPYTGAYVRIDSVSSFGDFSLAVRP